MCVRQVVGLPFKDETVLRAMRMITELVPFSSRPAASKSYQHAFGGR